MAKQRPCPNCAKPLNLDGVAGAGHVVCAACGARIRLTTRPATPAVPPPEPKPDHGFEVVEEAGFEVIADEPPRPEPVRAVAVGEEPRRPRRSKRRPVRKPDRGGLSRRLVALVGGGVATALVVFGVAFVLLTGGAEGGSVGGEDSGDGSAVAAARPAAPPAPQFDETPRPTIDAATWRVKADPAPPAVGLKLPAYFDAGTGVEFADPVAAKAVGLGLDRATGLALILVTDLRTGETRRLASPAPAMHRLMRVALSPTGERVASVAGGPPEDASGFPIGTELKTLTVVSAADGRKVWSVRLEDVLAPPGADTSEARQAVARSADDSLWLRVSRDHMLVYSAGRLTAYNARPGDMAFTANTPFTDTLRLTPGRRWLYGPTAAGVQFLDARDGSPAGTVAVPPIWLEDRASKESLVTGRNSLHLSIDLDGTRAALVGSKQNAMGSRVALIDLASAAVTGCKDCQSLLPHAPELRWVGHGLLLTTGGGILNWELGMKVGRYDCGPLHATCYWPDRRLWGVGAGPAAAVAAAKLGKGPQQFLTAVTVPRPEEVGELTRNIGLPFPPGTPLRVTAAGPGGAGRYEAIAEVAAKALAAAGYPIDPDAKVGVRVVVTEVVAEQKTVGDYDRRISQAERDRYERVHGYDNNRDLVAVKRVTGLKGVGKVQAFDESGQTVKELINILVETNTEDKDVFYGAIGDKARLAVDRDDAQKRRLNGDSRFSSGHSPNAGIDGVVPEK